MTLSRSDLIKDMRKTFKSAIGPSWNEVKDYADDEIKKIAEAVLLIAKQRNEGKISEEEAWFLLDMQVDSSKSVLRLQALGILEVEKAITVAMHAIEQKMQQVLLSEGGSRDH